MLPAGSDRTRTGRHRLRFWCGLALLGASVLLPVTALLFPWLGLPGASSSLLVGLMVAGGPELLCLAAVALLGNEGYNRLRGAAPEEQRIVSRLRYYGGLTYCLLNALPVSLYAYVPEWMPGGAARYAILALADLTFVASLFLMGGEFWEKFRLLFLWQGKG